MCWKWTVLFHVVSLLLHIWTSWHLEGNAPPSPWPRPSPGHLGRWAQPLTARSSCQILSLNNPPPLISEMNLPFQRICEELRRFWCYFFEPTCAYARWAHMHCFLYVWMSVTRPKFISLKPLHLGLWNLVWAWTWMTQRSTLKVKVIGQRSRSPSQKAWFEAHLTGLQIMWEVKGHMGQWWHGSRSKVIRSMSGLCPWPRP